MEESEGADPLVRVVVTWVDVPDGAAPTFVALLRRYGDGSMELVGADAERLPELPTHGALEVALAVAGDAMYAQRVHVIGQPANRWTARVEPEGAQQRQQQRDFVRVETTPFNVIMVLPGPDPAAEDGAEDGADEDPVASITHERAATMRDISAGGTRLFHDGERLTPGLRLGLRFALPSEGAPPYPLSLEGDVMWTGAAPYDRAAAGIRFVDLDRATERRLTSWVFQYQAKVLREGKR